MSQPFASPETAETGVRGRLARKSDLMFFLVMSGLSASFVVLIVLLLAADVMFTSFADFREVLLKPEIRAAIRLTLLTCSIAALMSLWVGTPLGYLLSRFRFPGRWLVDTLVDIPVVLPPLVLGLSLLILFHLPIGGADGWRLETWLRDDIRLPVTYRWPAVILAQFSVACAFAVRTMRVTFDQIDPRAEDVARTLGCTRSQAFLQIALPQAWRGMIAAGTISWARALGEFGPILVFAGATRMKTEVLSTSVFLELSIGNLDAAVAVSLLMVLMAVTVLLILRDWHEADRMIELRDVTIMVGKFALEHVSFRIESGKYAVLMGRTGQGKTTILEAICGLRSIVSGKILVHHLDVSLWSPGERGIGYVPQDLALFPTMTVQQQLEFALRLRHTPARKMADRVAELSDVLGISKLLQRHVQGLSGGEAQRVALGRALSFHPSVLLLDEPLSALDEATRRQMHALLRRVKEMTGVTLLHVTHSNDDAEALADQRLVLEAGKVVESP